MIIAFKPGEKIESIILKEVHNYVVGDYQRAFTLSDEIDRDRIQATVKNGILRLILPKAKSAKTRKISVKAEA